MIIEADTRVYNFAKLMGNEDYEINFVELDNSKSGIQYPYKKLIEINLSLLDDDNEDQMLAVLSHEVGHCKTYARSQYLREFHASMWAIRRNEEVRKDNDEYDFRSIRNRLILTFLLWENDSPARYRKSAYFARQCGILSYLEYCLISNTECDIDELSDIYESNFVSD